MNKETMGWVHVVAFVLVVVGALNWGLMGALNINLVTWLFGMGSVAQLVYILVGLSALYLVLTHGNECMTCMSMMGKKKGKKR